MPDRPTEPIRKPMPAFAFNDPDAQNAGQAEAGSQAHDVAEDARTANVGLAEESERGGRSNPGEFLPGDTPDLVETMNAMNRSCRIDMGAFEGEENLEDEPDD